MKDHINIIMQHLSGAEILQASLASREMNELIGKSKAFARKIQLTITDLKSLPPKANSRKQLDHVMKNSKRKYHNINIRADELGEEEIKLFFRNDWTDAMISISRVKSSMKFVKYLGPLVPTLTSLSLTIGKIKKVNPNIKLEASSLKKLSFLQCTSAALEMFVKDQDNTSIEDLILCAVHQSVQKNSTSLTRIYDRLVESFLALVILDITSSITAGEFFKNDISDRVRFNLKQLTVVAPASLKACENIEKFAMSQGKSLEEICLLEWSKTDTVYQIWNKLVMLKAFRICSRSAEEFSDMSHHQDLQSRRLDLLYFDFPESEISMEYLNPLLMLSPLLGKLHINVKTITADLYEIVKNSALNVIVNGITLADDLSSDNQSEASKSSYKSSDSAESSCVITQAYDIPMFEISDSDSNQEQ